MIRVSGNNITFGAKTGSNVLMSSIDNIKLDYAGVIKEFPELANEVNWREEAIAKFKDKIRDLKTEEQILKYLIEDLSRWGYKALYKQKQGFRKELIHGN